MESLICFKLFTLAIDYALIDVKDTAIDNYMN